MSSDISQMTAEEAMKILENMASADTPEALNALLDGRSDDEILLGLSTQGIDTVLARVFEQMERRFIAERAPDKNVVVQFDITHPDGTETWHAVIAGGKCVTDHGATADPSLTLELSAPDFLRLISGKLDGVRAFMTRKLRIKGDLLLAPSFQRWFRMS